MTYLQRSSEKNSRRRRNIKFASIFLAIILFGFLLRTFSGNVVHSVLYPVNKATQFVFSPFKNFGTYLHSKTKLVEENKNLVNDKKFLQIELLSVENLREENDELRKNLELTKDTGEVTAEIVLTPPFSPFDTFVVHTDNIDAVKIGDRVLANGILVGEVIEKHARNAIVKLFSTSGTKMPVKINDEIVAEAVGQGGLSFLIQLPKDILIEKGFLVYAEGADKSILGTVENIDTPENSSFQTIYFKFPFSFADLNFVQIKGV